MRMDNYEEKEYEKLMNEKDPHNPYLEKDEIGVLEVQMDVVCEELKEQYSLEELADILRKMSSEAGDRMQMCSIHMFASVYKGIHNKTTKYGLPTY